MILSKFWASNIVWMLLSTSTAYSQALDYSAPLPKWEFGLRGGAGLSSLHLDRRQSLVVISSRSRGRGYNDPTRHGELYIGSYATRHFGRHWSVRSELSLISQTYVAMSGSLGIFPRYCLTNWLSLETGIEGFCAVQRCRRRPLRRARWPAGRQRFAGQKSAGKPGG